MARRPTKKLTPLGQELERRRAAAALSKGAVVELARTSRSQYDRILYGTVHSGVELLVRVAAALKLDPQEALRLAGVDLELATQLNPAVERALVERPGFRLAS